jgi:uncharacterized protein (TIGR03437 family)
VYRLLLTLAGVALFSIGILSLNSMLSNTSAQTTTREDIIVPFTLPNNINGTRVRGASYDGNRLVFESNNNYFGENGDQNFEIYVYDKSLQQLIQVTNTNPGTDPSNATFIVDNLAPVITGDGTQIAFYSNATSLDPANPNPNGNFEIYKAILPRGATTASSFKRITNTGRNLDSDPLRRLFGNTDPVISDDGNTIVFLSSRQNFNTVNGIPAFAANNPDRNAEVMVCNLTDTGGQYRQLTVSNPADRPSPNLPGGVNYGVKISGNGQMVAFVSDFNYDPARVNNDANEEIFIYNLINNSFRQVTQTSLSAPFNAVVPICDITTGVCSIDPTAGFNSIPVSNRALSSDGRLLVFESSGNLDGANNTKTRNLFVYDTITGAQRRVTNQTVSPTPTQDELRVVDYNFMPSFNSAGTAITFESTLNLNNDNADGSSEVFQFDLASGSFRQLTSTPTSNLFLDQRSNKTASFLSDVSSTGETTGETTVSFSYPTLSFLPNATSAIDLFQVRTRPVSSPNNSGTAIGNAASFNTNQVARGSLAVTLNTQINDATGVSVSFNRVAAPIISLSGGRVTVLVPNGSATGNTPYSINDNGVQYTGTSNIVDAFPGVFSLDGSGTGPGSIVCLSKFRDGTDVYSDPPCAPSNDNMTSILFGLGTGWRNAAGGIQVKINDRTLDVVYSGPEGGNGGLRDQFNVMIPSDLRGVTNADLSVILRDNTSAESNKTKVSFQGGPTSLTVSGLTCLIKSVGLPDVYAPPPCPVSSPSTLSVMVIFGFGWRNATSTQVKIDNDVLTPIFSGPQSTGDLDQINLIIPSTLVGRTGQLSVIVPETNVESNRVGVSFLPNPTSLTLSAAADCLVKTPGQPDVFMPPPCPVSNGDTVSILVLYGSGWRFATGTQVKIDNDLLTPVYSGPQLTSGVDQINLILPQSLAGRTGQVSVVIPGTSVESNRVSIPFQAGP